MTTLAMTGGTGFVGGASIDQALSSGFRVRALTRRPQAPREGVTWIEGDLHNAEALEKLATGAHALIHIAGVVNVPTRAAFEAGNAGGTANVIAAMQQAGVRRLVHVSSLAAREPELSDYGWSKALAEQHVRGSGLDWTIIRPPAIYGANDREMLELFIAARRGIVPVPPAGKVSVIEVTDLARLLVTACERQDMGIGALWEVDDGTPGGWTHRDFGLALGEAVGRKVRVFQTPAWLMRLGARVHMWARGSKAKLTLDRAAYFCHPDWVSTPALAPPAELWQAALPAREGLAATAAAYRAKGWL